MLWIALIVNASMFVVELAAGHRAASASLLADAVDFLGDAANYAVSLFVLSLAAIWRSRTALAKGITMGLYGFFVLGRVAWGVVQGAMPHATTMGVIGLLALAANVAVAVMLYAYREGDANMRSVWLCSRNDAIGNVEVMAAALAVAMTSSMWPDLLVAIAMSVLALSASRAVVTQARREMSTA
ncbi:MAG TPA: cation transporter [Steroidobacteraceae bacterium]|nr:cation transporter [Steroidobacteraceae bacterium]